MNDSKFMRYAIDLSCRNVASGGGPFGAVIVLRSKIVGEGTNLVVPTGDPTAHAEIVAIRDACRRLGSHRLEGGVIYTSCEPCPMCLGAIWWARISKIVYGNSRDDAAEIGFDDEAIYKEVAASIENRQLPMRRLLAKEAIRAFDLWLKTPDRVRY